MIAKIIALGLAVALAGFSAEATFKKTRLVTVEKSKQKFVDVQLRVGDNGIVIAEKKTSAVRAEIPYSRIKSISYEMSKRRRTSEGAVIMLASLGAGAVVMLTKSKSHWLTIETGEDGALSETVLQLHKDEYGPAIAALEASGGKPVTILTDKEGKVNPTAGSKNVDEIVPYPVSHVRAALKPAMEKFACRVTDEEDDKVECKRARVANEATGGGNEKITVKLRAEGASTRVTVETGKGFIGRLGKKNWSEPIFEEMKKNLESLSAKL